MTKWITFTLTLLLAALIGTLAAQPPAPLPATAPADQFSAARAMADIRIIAAQPHPTASPENAAARAYLITRLQSLGFATRTITTPLPEKSRQRLKIWGSPNAGTAIATSIIALRAGRDPGAPAVAIMAHYDSVWASPGAADDSTGVAAALEIARAIPRASQRRDLVLLITDAEELGLVGARGFFGRDAKGDAVGLGDPLAGRIGAVVDLESRGGGGRAVMFETGRDNGAMIDMFAASVRHPAANSLAVKIYELLPNSTDFTPVKQRGIAGFNFAFMGRAELYHSPLATPDAIDIRSVQHMGEQGLDITRALVTAAALPAAAPDAVFSDVLGQFVITYPPSVGWLILAATAGLTVFAARRHRADWTWRQLSAAIVDGLVFGALAGLLLYAGNLLSGADGPTNYYDRLAALPRLETQALLLFAAGMFFGLALLPRPRAYWNGWIGLALLNFAIVAVIQAMLPAAAPIFAWPLLLIAAAMALVSLWPRHPLFAPMVAAIFGLAFAGGFAHFALLAIGGPTPMALALFAPMTLLLLWPLLPPFSRRSAVITALLLVLAAGSIALWVRTDPMAATIPPYNPRG